ncbi:MAG TPA: HlyD family secretion protein [Chitinophagales bacterium]|nr:HlyD family secretion protein [Chitinophagales bacterium]
MAENKKSRKLILPLILGIIVIGGSAYGVSEYIYSLHHVNTDDAQIDSDISPVVTRVTGYVDSIFFEENQMVKKGQVLIKLDDRDLRIKLEQAQAALDNAVANVAVAQANVSTTQASNNASQASIENAKIDVWKATQDFNRYQNLLADQSITQQQFDAAKAEKESAEARLQLAQKQLTTGTVQTNATSRQIAVAQSMVTARQADVDFALLQLSYATITAPASGIASKKTVQTGQLVQTGQTLFNVVSDSDVYVIANFKETQLDEMKQGQHVTVKVDAFPKDKMEGTVYSFAPATGAKFSLLPPDNATGNFVKVIQRVPVKIKLTNSKEHVQVLRPGMSVKVTVDL